MSEERRALYSAVMEGGPHSPDRSERAGALIDDFVHSLAEKQREELRGPDGTLCDCGLDYCLSCDIQAVINLIDPKKDSDG